MKKNCLLHYMCRTGTLYTVCYWLPCMCSVLLVAMYVQCVMGGHVRTVCYWLPCTYSVLWVAMYVQCVTGCHVRTVCYWLPCTYSVLWVAMYVQCVTGCHVRTVCYWLSYMYGTSHSKLHDVRRSINGQSTVDQRSVNGHEAVKVHTYKMADLIDFQFSK